VRVCASTWIHFLHDRVSPIPPILYGGGEKKKKRKRKENARTRKKKRKENAKEKSDNSLRNVYCQIDGQHAMESRFLNRGFFSFTRTDINPHRFFFFTRTDINPHGY